MQPSHSTIGFIGFGEAAQAFTRGFQQENADLNFCAFDKKTDGPQNSQKNAEYESAGVSGKTAPVDVSSEADVIFSLVTADQAGIAAEAVSKAKLDGTLFFDCNSCAPETKRQSAGKVTAAGGRYIDVAIMTPVHPKLHKAPTLVAGPDAEFAVKTMQSLGMVAQVAGASVGEASERKMIRSVMIKGLEALTLECFLAAHKAGIEDYLLNSLEGSFPGFNWKERSAYMFERAMTHGVRRAAEMEEVAKTLRDLGIAPNMTEGTVARQRQVGEMRLNSADFDVDDVSSLARAILAAQASLHDEEKQS